MTVTGPPIAVGVGTTHVATALEAGMPRWTSEVGMTHAAVAGVLRIFRLRVGAGTTHVATAGGARIEPD